MGGGGQDSYFHLAWGRTWVRLPVESLPTSHSPLAEMLQSHFIKKPKLMGLDLGSHCLGPSPISGNEGTTLGGSQSCAGWARESENRKVARAPATDCLSECHRVQANSSLTRGTRAVGLKEGVPGVLTPCHPIQRANKHSCWASRATPTPTGYQRWSSLKSCWPQGQAPETPGKGLPESWGLFTATTSS